MSEANAGSDVVSMKCKAEKRGTETFGTYSKKPSIKIMRLKVQNMSVEFCITFWFLIRRRLLHIKWYKILDNKWSRCRYTCSVCQNRSYNQQATTWCDSFSRGKGVVIAYLSICLKLNWSTTLNALTSNYLQFGYCWIVHTCIL